jgi:hypothetical protein
MPDVHLTDEQITQYRDGVLWNPVVAGHLRSCSVCQDRLRETRLLRALLARPEQKKSAHPSSEELAYFLEGRPVGMAFTKVEAHVAGCPQCFADLQAIREQFQPRPMQEERPPEWVVARAVGSFRPPQTPLSLGTLVVEWVRRFGLSLRLIPAAREAGAFAGAVFQLRDVGSLPSPSKAAPPAVGRERSYDDLDLSIAPEERSDLSGIRAGQASDSIPPVREPEPVEVTVGDLCVRITVRGRAQDQVHMLIVITRREDNAPVAGIALAMATETGPPVSATTDTSGGATFSLTQGEGTLTFLSPIRAELKISF